MPEGGQIYHLNTCSSRHFEPLFLTGIIKRQLHQQRSEREVRKIAGEGGGEKERERGRDARKTVAVFRACSAWWD